MRYGKGKKVWMKKRGKERKKPTPDSINQHGRSMHKSVGLWYPPPLHISYTTCLLLPHCKHSHYTNSSFICVCIYIYIYHPISHCTLCNIFLLLLLIILLFLPFWLQHHHHSTPSNMGGISLEEIKNENVDLVYIYTSSLFILILPLSTDHHVLTFF